MERGNYRGFRRRSDDAVAEPRRLGVVTNASTSQTGVTTVTDLTGLALTFSVSRYPVEVELYVPFIYGSVALDTLAISIADSAGTDLAIAYHPNPVAVTSGTLICKYLIETLGAYSVKGRFRRDSGTGTANTFVGATLTQYIKATEVRV